jgi:hypothetical protein
MFFVNSKIAAAKKIILFGNMFNLAYYIGGPEILRFPG